MKELKERNALLTGASRGLGVHIARALAKEGVNLALTARSVDALEQLREEVISHNIKAVAIPADLSDTEQVTTLEDKVEDKLGPIDILINNAGIEWATPFRNYSPQELQKMIQVNFTAPMLLTRFVLPGMLDRGRGHIVNMSSLAGKAGFPYQTPYASTKAGLVMFTNSLRMELDDTPVGVSVICPGFVAEDGMYAEMEKRAGPAPRLLKPTTPDKVASAVIKAIKKDKAEILVSALPVRPAFIIQEIFPGIKNTLNKVLGATAYAEKISDRQSE
ncbi:MAG: SDR family NAD(P)-dependent oxidoreductase [Balneolaceae bacterium]|nr:SDR family NAD(P)-dependent oxidoreductase [Balneolaceae bacterium]